MGNTKLSFLTPPSVKTSQGNMVQNNFNSVQQLLESKMADPVKEDNAQKILMGLAHSIIHNPEQLKNVLRKNGVSVSNQMTRLQLKDALMKKIQQRDHVFNDNLAMVLSPHVSASKYSNLFGIDDIIGTLGLITGGDSGTKVDTQVTNNLIKLQQDKEKTQRQQALIGFGLFGLILITTAIVVVKSK